MAIANEIGMEMARTAGQAPQMQIGTAAAQGAATGEAYRSGFQAQNKEAAAAQFQEVLNQGYQGMVQTFKSLAPEEQQIVGDPGLYQRSEDTMAAWWGMVAKAKKQTEQKTALATGTQQIVAGDKVGGNATLMQSGNITADQGASNIEAANKEAKNRKLGQTITEEFNKKEPAPSGRHSKNAFVKRFMDTLSVVESNDQDIGAHPKAANGLQAFGRLGVVPELHAQRVGLDPKNQKDLETFRNSPELQAAAAEDFVMELGKKYDWDARKMRMGYYGITKDPDAKQGLMDGRSMPSGNEDADRFMAAFGSAQAAKDAENVSTKMQDMVMRLAKIDPDAPNHPLTKVLLDAMDKDADNAKTKHESNINDIRTRAQALKENNALQVRIEKASKRVKPKLDVSRDFDALNAAMPGGLYGSKDISGAGVGAKLWRKWLLTEEAGNFRTALAALSNDKLRIASGQTVTDGEANRMAAELGLTLTDSVAVFRKALQTMYEKNKASYEEDMLFDPEAALEMTTRNPGLSKAFLLKANAGGQFTTKSGKSIKVTKTVKN